MGWWTVWTPPEIRKLRGSAKELLQNPEFPRMIRTLKRGRIAHCMKFHSRITPFLLIVLALLAVAGAQAQDWIHTGSNLGNNRIRLAAADFKPVGGDPQTPALKAVFDATLFSDLQNAGIFDMVSKSMIPQAMPGSPQEINLAQWSAAPSNAAMVAYGALSATNGRLVVYGWLFDTSNAANPQVLAQQYNEAASEEMARTIAHRFADAIILRLGGGINGIAETKIYFVSSRTGTKEIWGMDYDGQNQHQITHLGTISLSPRISPDNSRIAFASLGHNGWDVRMYSLELGRVVSFPAGTAGGSNQSPAWSADGTKIAFSSSRSGDPEIWVVDAERRQSAPGHLLPRARRVACLEPAHQRSNCLGERTHRPAADLHHGSGRLECPADDRRRLRNLAVVVAQRTVPDLQLESQIRPRRTRRARHLRDGHCQQALAAIDPRGRQQRFSLVGAGRPAHRL